MSKTKAQLEDELYYYEWREHVLHKVLTALVPDVDQLANMLQAADDEFRAECTQQAVAMGIFDKKKGK